MEQTIRNYAERAEIPLKLAERRLQVLKGIAHLELKARLCPNCNDYTLYKAYTHQDGSIATVIFCSNKYVPKIDSEGWQYHEDCAYISDITGRHIFIDSKSKDYNFECDDFRNTFPTVEKWVEFIDYQTMLLEKYVLKRE